MKRYIITALVICIIEIGLLFGFALIFTTSLPDTLFWGSIIFAFLSYITSSSGDILSKGAEHAAFNALGGAYTPKHEKMSVRVGPFLVGSILCLVVCWILLFFL